MRNYGQAGDMSVSVFRLTLVVPQTATYCIILACICRWPVIRRRLSFLFFFSLVLSMDPVPVAVPVPRFRKRSLTGDCIPNRDLFRVYRDFGLHQISPRSLVPEMTCGDDLFARGRLYNNTEKDFQHPVG